jgi:membrane dipeptidase
MAPRTAQEIHQSALVVDGHVDTSQRFLDDGWNFSDPIGSGMLNLASARAANLAATFFALWVDPSEHPVGTHNARALALGAAVHEQLRRHPDDLQLCTSPRDILQAKKNGRFAIMLSVEGGHAIEESLEKLREFHSLGVRSMTLTWNNSLPWADSCVEPNPTPGLSPFGRDVIHELNRLGILIDISHASDQTFADTLATSRAPIIATHSCARALTPSPRNLTDDQLRALAARGGLCMVNFFPAFLDATWRDAWNALEPARKLRHQQVAAPYRAAGKPVPFSVSTAVDREFDAQLPRAPFSSLIAHIEHIIHVAGIDHVGLGSDFDGIPSLPEGLESATDIPKITEALFARSYSAEGLHKLLGGNFLRVFAAVQQMA